MDELQGGNVGFSLPPIGKGSSKGEHSMRVACMHGWLADRHNLTSVFAGSRGLVVPQRGVLPGREGGLMMMMSCLHKLDNRPLGIHLDVHHNE